LQLVQYCYLIKYNIIRLAPNRKALLPAAQLCDTSKGLRFNWFLGSLGLLSRYEQWGLQLKEE